MGCVCDLGGTGRPGLRAVLRAGGEGTWFWIL